MMYFVLANKILWSSLIRHLQSSPTSTRVSAGHLRSEEPAPRLCISHPTRGAMSGPSGRWSMAKRSWRCARRGWRGGTGLRGTRTGRVGDPPVVRRRGAQPPAQSSHTLPFTPAPPCRTRRTPRQKHPTALRLISDLPCHRVRIGWPRTKPGGAGPAPCAASSTCHGKRASQLVEVLATTTGPISPASSSLLDSFQTWKLHAPAASTCQQPMIAETAPVTRSMNHVLKILQIQGCMVEKSMNLMIHNTLFVLGHMIKGKYERLILCGFFKIGASTVVHTHLPPSTTRQSSQSMRFYSESGTYVQKNTPADMVWARDPGDLLNGTGEFDAQHHLLCI